MSAAAAWRYLRFAWGAATDRDRASLLVCLLLWGMTMVSLMYSSGVDAVNKLCWLAAFSVIIWGQLGSIVDRAIQDALTTEFLRSARDGMSPVTVEFAGMEHVHLEGHGWKKIVRE
jgi:hypothetical protein